RCHCDNDRLHPSPRRRTQSEEFRARRSNSQATERIGRDARRPPRRQDRLAGGMSARILGLDPGLQITGYAVVESSPRGPLICEAGVIKGADTKSAKPDTPRRLANLYASLVEILDQFRPSAVAIEQLYSHYAHPRTA